MARDTKQDHPLRVAQLIESMDVGGAENLAVRTANHLARSGHESHLIVSRGPGVLSARVLPEVRVHYPGFERASIRNPLAFGLSLRRCGAVIGRIVEDNRIQVLQTHLPGSNFLGLLLAWRKACGVLATIHNNQEFNYGDADNRLLAALRKSAYRRILAVSQGVIAVSDEVRNSLIRDLGAGPDAAGRISVVTNAVEVPEPMDEEERRVSREELGVGPGDLLVLAAGRFTAQKNFGDLISAAGDLRDRGVAFRLVIGGDGEDRPEMARRIGAAGLEGHVSLPGNLTNLDRVMQASDVFVMSSLWEGLPLVLLEAMAAGLPVVAYEIAGIGEVLAGGETGLTVPVGVPGGLADGLERLAGDPGLRAGMGAAGRQVIVERYGFDSYVGRLTGLYREAIRAMECGP